MNKARFLVVFDADSTLLADEVIELIADEAGRRGEVAAVTEAAMRGELDFAESLRERARALAGVPTAAFDRVIDRVTPTLGAAALITAIHDRGGRAAVVSGGFHEVLDTVAPALGVDVWRANRLDAAAGALTGLVDGPIVDAAKKASTLTAWAEQYGVPRSRTIAAGDGANDLLMLAAAGLGLAFNAKPTVRENADAVIGAADLRELIPLLP